MWGKKNEDKSDENNLKDFNRYWSWRIDPKTRKKYVYENTTYWPGLTNLPYMKPIEDDRFVDAIGPEPETDEERMRRIFNQNSTSVNMARIEKLTPEISKVSDSQFNKDISLPNKNRVYDWFTGDNKKYLDKKELEFQTEKQKTLDDLNKKKQDAILNRSFDETARHIRDDTVHEYNEKEATQNKARQDERDERQLLVSRDRAQQEDKDMYSERNKSNSALGVVINNLVRG
jgi:hypothetical protein